MRDQHRQDNTSDRLRMRTRVRIRAQSSTHVATSTTSGSGTTYPYPTTTRDRALLSTHFTANTTCSKRRLWDPKFCTR